MPQTYFTTNDIADFKAKLHILRKKLEQNTKKKTESDIRLKLEQATNNKLEIEQKELKKQIQKFEDILKYAENTIKKTSVKVKRLFRK